MVPAPGQVLNIGTGDGQNHFNVGIGRPSGHTDYSPATIEGGYESDPEFIATPDGLAVQFRVEMDAATTSSGTDYPRSELREYNEAGTGQASWDGGTGNHYMEGISRVTHLPPVKPWAVFCQIHDSSSDLIRVQTEGTSTSALKLVARNTPPGGSEETVTVQASYTLGDDIHWRLEVTDGAGTLYIGGVAVRSFPADQTGCYFKAGCYAQSNDTIDSASEYASIELRNLVHGHTGWPEPQGSGTPGGGTATQTLGVGGIAAPAPASNVVLVSADSASTLTITTDGMIYDGQGHTVPKIDIEANDVTVQNFYVSGGGNSGIYSFGTGNIIQNNDISNISEAGTGDINAITFFGDNTHILYNNIDNLVSGAPNGSHTDGVQTWNTPSKQSSSNVLILGNRFNGPTDADPAYLHQGVMAEGKDSTDGGGGGTGVSQHWLVDSNWFKTYGNQCLKFDDVSDVQITRNTFAGSATKVVETGTLSTGIKYYSDNNVTGSYGSVGVTTTAGAGPDASGWGYTGGGSTPATPAQFKMAFASCINDTDSAAFDAMAALAPDFFYMAGDCWYDDGSSGFNAHWNAKFSATHYAGMLANLPNEQIVGWSDHDSTFQSNGTGLQYPSVIADANSSYRTQFPGLTLPANGIYRDFVVGRIQFVLCDERTFKSVNSATDNSSKTMLGSTQKSWLLNILANPSAPMVVILGDSPWVGSTTSGDDSWKGYNTERQQIGNACAASSAVVIRLSGDMHCLAYGHDQIGIDRVWQAAPLANASKVKEGGAGYLETYPTNANEGSTEHLFGMVTFTDDGSQITATFVGHDTDGTERLTDSISVSAPGGTPPGGGGTPPSYAIDNVRVGNTAIVGNASTSPPFPAGLIEGDLLLMRDTVIRFSTTAQPATPGTPAGWTRKATEASPVGGMAHASIRYTWYYARYDPTGVNGISSPPTVTYSGTAGDEHHTQITACAGAWTTGDPTDVLGSFAVSPANSNSQIGPAPGITTTYDGGLVLGIIASEYDTTGGIGNFSGESLTWVEDDEHGDGNVNDWAYGYDHALVPTARAIADKYLACSVNTAGRSVGQMWAIKPQPDKFPVTATGVVSWQVKGLAIVAGRARWTVRAARAGVRKVRFKVRAHATATRPVLWEVKRSAIIARTVRWEARGRAIAARTVRFKARALRPATRRALWDVRQTLTAPRVARWAVRIPTGVVTGPVRWSARALVGPTRLTRWSARAGQLAPRPVSWSVRDLSGVATRPVSWSVRGLTRGPAPVSWSTRALTSVTTRVVRWSARVTGSAPARAVSWSVRALVAGARPVLWATRARAAGARVVAWSTRVVSGTAARVARWDVRAPVGAVGTVRWLVTAPTVHVARAVTVRWDTRAVLVSGRTGRWQVRGLTAETGVARWDTRGTAGTTAAAKWAARVTVPATRRARWSTRTLIARARALVWDARATTRGTGETRWSVKARTGATAAALWDTRARTAATRAVRWSVRELTTTTRAARWATRATTPAARAVRWSARATTRATQATRWRVAELTRTTRAAVWDTRRAVAATRTTRWSTRHTTTATRRARWAVVGVTRAARRVRWRIVQTADQALIPGRLTATAADKSHLTATATSKSTLSATVTTTDHLTATTNDPEE
jgi:hypothetical protein